MKTTKLVVLASMMWLNAVFAQEKKVNDDTQTVQRFILKLPRIEVIPIKDTETDRQYELYIKLPEEYSENNDKKYPVIYFTDAMWHVEILSGSAEYILEEAILVGISWQKDINEELQKEAGAHVSRYRDYSIQKLSNPEHQATYQFGQASNHLTFIRNDVIGYVEKNYRTDPERRTYFGYSLGGLFGAYILLAQPDTFNNYILGSPSLEGDIPILAELDSSAALKRKDLNTNVFFSYGALEKELGEYAEAFTKMLKNSNNEHLSLHHEVLEGTHQTAFPMTAVRGVTWLSKLNHFAILEGPYLGQKPPGSTPEPFAPSIVTTADWEVGGAFTPDLKEFYFIREVGDVAENKKMEFVVIQNTNNRWQESVISPRVGQPFITPDGKIMHLGKRYKERTETGDWSALKKLGSPFEEIQIMRLTASAKGTYVFDEMHPDGDGVLRYSRLIGGKREEPKPFGKEINTGKSNAHPFIAPDGSYILWDSRRDSGYGKADIYISFRQQDGSWGAAINLGDKVNTDTSEAGASVTPDGKYLFFNRNMGYTNSVKYEDVDIYWVDAQIIETLRPKKDTIKK